MDGIIMDATHIVYRALSVMAADPQSPLAHDERYAIVCWLQGMDSNVLILLPDDVAAKLLEYIAEHHPMMAYELSVALAGKVPVLPPAPLFDSPLENAFALAWQGQGFDDLYPLTAQYPINGGQYRMDFAFAPLRVGIELDSYTYHSDRETFTRDRQRQREIEAQGWHILRFTGDELRKDILRCVYEAANFLSIQQYRESKRKE